jgi:hypothetical protein
MVDIIIKAVDKKYFKKQKHTNMFIEQWLHETMTKAFVACSGGNQSVGYVILHRVDEDPCKKHTDPYVLDYICTAHTFRRKGIASALLKHVSSLYDLTAITSSVESDALFAKNEWYDIGGGIYRHDRRQNSMTVQQVNTVLIHSNNTVRLVCKHVCGCSIQWMSENKKNKTDLIEFVQNAIYVPCPWCGSMSGQKSNAPDDGTPVKLSYTPFFYSRATD